MGGGVSVWSSCCPAQIRNVGKRLKDCPRSWTSEGRTALAHSLSRPPFQTSSGGLNVPGWPLPPGFCPPRRPLHHHFHPFPIPPASPNPTPDPHPRPDCVSLSLNSPIMARSSLDVVSVHMCVAVWVWGDYRISPNTQGICIGKFRNPKNPARGFSWNSNEEDALCRPPSLIHTSTHTHTPFFAPQT